MDAGAWNSWQASAEGDGARQQPAAHDQPEALDAHDQSAEGGAGSAWCEMRHRPPKPELHVEATFAQRAEQVRRLRDKGVVRGYIHVDGWGKRGFDNFHPDPLPPCEEAGGWEGFQQLAEAAQQAGYLFALHDNYDDYYLDSPAWNEALAIKEANGKSPRVNDWEGGPQSYLCPVVALPFVQYTLGEMERHAVKLTACYVDDLTSVALRECYDPQHPVTREQYVQANQKLLRDVESRGIVTSSENGAEWGVPVLEHIGMLLWPEHGVPVPLFHLVYHDALVVPASVPSLVKPPREVAKHYGSATDDDRRQQCLRGILYGQMPILRMENCFQDKLLQRALLMAKVHQRTEPAEMVDHQFLSSDRQIQECKFSNGVRVRAAFAAKTFQVSGTENFPSAIMSVPSAQ